MQSAIDSAFRKRENIKKSQLTIYDPVEFGDKDYWYTSEELMAILNEELVGTILSGLPLRTRSKVVKTSICEALGYGIPNSFKKVQPRFKGQNFDTYVQKSNNLQIWNEDLDPTRSITVLLKFETCFSRPEETFFPGFSNLEVMS